MSFIKRWFSKKETLAKKEREEENSADLRSSDYESPAANTSVKSPLRRSDNDLTREVTETNRQGGLLGGLAAYQSEPNLHGESESREYRPDRGNERSNKRFSSCSNLLETVTEETVFGHRTTSYTNLTGRQTELEDEGHRTYRYISKLQEELRNKDREIERLREELRQKNQINIETVESLHKFYMDSTSNQDRREEINMWFVKIEKSLEDMKLQIVNSVNALKHNFNRYEEDVPDGHDEVSDEIQKLCSLLYNLVGGKWRDFAHALRIPAQSIARIQSQHEGRIELGDVFFKIIREWKTRVGASVTGLLTACEAIGINPLKDKPMSETHRRVLQNKAHRLREDLIVPVFCSNVRDHDVLSDAEVQYIMATRIHNERINRLLDVAPFAGECGLSHFIDVLIETDHIHLANELIEEEKLLEANKMHSHSVRDSLDSAFSRQLSVAESIPQDRYTYNRSPSLLREATV